MNINKKFFQKIKLFILIPLFILLLISIPIHYQKTYQKDIKLNNDMNNKLITYIDLNRKHIEILKVKNKIESVKNPISQQSLEDIDLEEILKILEDPNIDKILEDPNLEKNFKEDGNWVTNMAYGAFSVWDGSTYSHLRIHKIDKANYHKVIELYEYYSPDIVEQFRNKYLSIENSQDKHIIEYIIKLIDYQQEIIKNFHSSEIEPFLYTPNLKRQSSKKPELKDSILKNTNFLFIGVTIICCLIVGIIYKIKNNKFISMTQIFLVIITVSTCFTSSNHLLNTLPNFSDRVSIFDIGIFSLGPIAVIWLSVKGIIDSISVDHKVTK